MSDWLCYLHSNRITKSDRLLARFSQGHSNTLEKQNHSSRAHVLVGNEKRARDNNVKLIVTALHLEARPFLDHFKLKRDTASSRIPVFRNADACLVISGPSKVRSAVATTWLLSQFADLEGAAVLNFGLCGCRDPTIPVGELFVINKIIDAGTDRSFFPDILFRHALPESSLTTYDRPVVENQLSETNTRLVDMEASGFYQAAASFLPPERILCAKLASDHLEESRLSKQRLEPLLENRVGDLERILAQAEQLSIKPFRHTEADIATLKSLKEALTLTVTQVHQLDDWARGYCIRNDTGLAILKPFLNRPCNTKQERNEILKVVLEFFLPTISF